jgi:uncharacterized MAPEG superfamily protein
VATWGGLRYTRRHDDRALMLTWSAILCLIVPNLGVAGLTAAPGGFVWGLGNRDQPFGELPAWAGRARRAHANLVENLIVFAALVLVAVAAGKTNAWTALGAQLFFWGRIAHLATYIAGLVPWRTWHSAWRSPGEWLIAFQLLR